MREGRVILDGRAQALTKVPLADLIDRLESGEEVEEIAGRSGVTYRLEIYGSWDTSEGASDYFVWLKLRAPTGLRWLWPWRATLMGYPPDDEFATWVQRQR